MDRRYAKNLYTIPLVLSIFGLVFFAFPLLLFIPLNLMLLLMLISGEAGGSFEFLVFFIACLFFGGLYSYSTVINSIIVYHARKRIYVPLSYGFWEEQTHGYIIRTIILCFISFNLIEIIAGVMYIILITNWHEWSKPAPGAYAVPPGFEGFPPPPPFMGHAPGFQPGLQSEEPEPENKGGIKPSLIFSIVICSIIFLCLCLSVLVAVQSGRLYAEGQARSSSFEGIEEMIAFFGFSLAGISTMFGIGAVIMAILFYKLNGLKKRITFCILACFFAVEAFAAAVIPFAMVLLSMVG